MVNKKRAIFSFLILMTVFVLISCQLVFTTSPIAALRRDPANLSQGQLTALGQSAIDSGDTATMIAVAQNLDFSLIPSIVDDPAMNVFVADLFLGASGINDMVDTVLSTDLAAVPDMAVFVNDMIIGGSAVVDTTALQMAANQVLAIDAAITAGTIPADTLSDSQYISAAAGMILVAADAAGGVENLDPRPGPGPALDAIIQAEALAAASGAELNDLLGGLGITVAI